MDAVPVGQLSASSSGYVKLAFSRQMKRTFSTSRATISVNARSATIPISLIAIKTAIIAECAKYVRPLSSSAEPKCELTNQG
jgi:hypothetical protein